MSLFSSINTAVSGLTAQSASFGNISEDVANSQTVGFKRVDTSFVDYLTTSSPVQNEPGAVVAKPDYVNSVQGTISQTDNPLGMAISGNGFFAVSRPASDSNNVPTFTNPQYYSRAGDFTMNRAGYLVNSAGDYLNGWPVNPSSNVVTQNALQPIRVSQATLLPQATTNMTLAANLPATPTSGTATAASPLSSQITVYDSNGTGHTVDLNWSQATNSTGAVIPNQWNVQIMVPDAAAKLGNGTTQNYTNAGSATVTFGNAASTSPPSGTIDSVIPSAAAPNSTVTQGTPQQSSGTPSDTFAVTVSNGTLKEVETKDDGTGSSTGLTTTTTNYSSFTSSAPVTSASSGTAGESVFKSTAADGTITLVDANDNGTTTSTTTYTIPPFSSSTLSGGGTYTAGTAGQAATLGFTTNFGSGNQTISLNLGTFGGTTGVTQFAGTSYNSNGSTQNGFPPGNFTGVVAQANGNVIVNYDNGQTRTIAQVPLITFAAPDALQSQNGQAFTATAASGTPLAQTAGTNGAGSILNGSVEGSNVDIATEFSNLIVAQQAYSANAKVVTTSDQLLQVTINMKT